MIAFCQILSFLWWSLKYFIRIWPVSQFLTKCISCIFFFFIHTSNAFTYSKFGERKKVLTIKSNFVHDMAYEVFHQCLSTQFLTKYISCVSFYPCIECLHLLEKIWIKTIKSTMQCYFVEICLCFHELYRGFKYFIRIWHHCV